MYACMCMQYTLGLLWFWQTDPSTGPALHEGMSALGFCTDEYHLRHIIP
jgi:hypothetical protein